MLEVREIGAASASISSRLLSPPVWLFHSSSIRLVMVALAARMVSVCDRPVVERRSASASPDRAWRVPSSRSPPLSLRRDSAERRKAVELRRPDVAASVSACASERACCACGS